MLRQFLLFAGANYYPAGGWDDYIDSFDSVEDAKAHVDAQASMRFDWWHVIDMTTGEEVA